MIEITARLKKVIFRNDDNFFSVVICINQNDMSEFTAVGNLPDVSEETLIELKGEWITHKKFGVQFKISSYEIARPVTLEGIYNFLASGILPGIGEKIALRIIQEFGEHSLVILENNPEKYLNIEGIGKKKLEQIVDKWKSMEEERRAMIYFTEHDISLSLAAKLINEYGYMVIDVIEDNPYILCQDINGIGFKRADEIAFKIGFSHDSPLRIEEACIYILDNSIKHGHIFLPVDLLLKNCSNLLEKDNIDSQMIKNAILRLRDKNRIVIETDDEYEYKIYTYQSWYMEQEIVSGIRDMSKVKFKDFEVHDEIDFFSGVPSFDQVSAFRKSLNNQFVVITGGPGTGKTTLIKAICTYFLKTGNDILVAAPTGRASKRITESTNLPAKTIHRLLEYSPFDRKFKRNSENTLCADAIIIDEASMLDYYLMYSLIEAISSDTRLILIGDADQLPSVGPGNILMDIINCGKIPVAKLTTIHRQSEGSLIIENAHRINCGDWQKVLSNLDEIEFNIKNTDDYKKAIDELRFSILKDISKNSEFNFFDYQVISPMNRGPCGTIVLNSILKPVYNRNRQPTPLKKGDYVYSIGDKVMQIVNNYDKHVFNGDMGIIKEIYPAKSEFIIQFNDSKVLYSFNEIDQITPAYVITVHKSQGSEFKKVYLLLTNHHHIMLQRNLIYTAVTRAKKSIEIIGSEYAFKKAVSNAETSQRFTSLKKKLQSVL